MSYLTGVGLTPYGRHEGSSTLDLMSRIHREFKSHCNLLPNSNPSSTRSPGSMPTKLRKRLKRDLPSSANREPLLGGASIIKCFIGNDAIASP